MRTSRRDFLKAGLLTLAPLSTSRTLLWAADQAQLPSRVHESIQAEDALQYLNRIVWMDRHFTIRRMSRLFRFDNSHQIEMITSITTHGNNISFWTGVNDREVVRNMLYKEKVNELLEWVQLN